MAARVTFDRVLRDDDDNSGQTIRDWRIESEIGTITVRLKHGSGFLLMRPEDVDLFVVDLNRAKVCAETMAEEKNR